ncbi:uncharacterized protein (AIM24 family) [Paenibacillus shirakamiensis]|uniref:Uncharacterized protein (AIM24 family) n=1 Tax=Paenibacillus shirakamiensis TaxID=1265935 RepID=A0ABS4JJ00_9BACL|nr:AIM24 family protein [Paenibacillus shirakamiensis]MBP2001672.1 uncharacterized protein (AIM24 family) [Paenibacillus shirakamiensis]
MQMIKETEGGHTSGQALRFVLAEEEQIHMLHPQQIIAYRGASSNRSDRFMNIKGMYRKKKLIQADLRGPCEVVTALPVGYSMRSIMLSDDSDLLYDFRHLFFYTEGIRMQTRILKLKNMFITRDAIKVKFSGKGQIGILTEGQVCEIRLSPDEPLYVDAGSVIAYPENATLQLAVYGNHLASQHMSYQWQMTGHGSVLLQAGRQSHKLEQDLKDDGLVKRVLREVIPFGGIFIK